MKATWGSQLLPLGKNQLSFLTMKSAHLSFMVFYKLLNCHSEVGKIPCLLFLSFPMPYGRHIWKLCRANVPLVIWTPELRWLLQVLSWNPGNRGDLFSGLDQIMWAIVIGVNQPAFGRLQEINFENPFSLGLPDWVLSDQLLEGLVTQAAKWSCSVSNKGLKPDEGSWN